MARNRRPGGRERGSTPASTRGRARGRVVEQPQAGSDWRIYRPAIWLAMIAVAVALLVTPVYWSALPLGAAVGIGLKIGRQRRRMR